MYLGSRRKAPRSSFMLNPMGEAQTIESPPIIDRPPTDSVPLTSAVMQPIYMMAPTPAPSAPMSFTYNGQVYQPSPVVGYALVGFSAYCLYAGVRDLFRMFKGGS